MWTIIIVFNSLFQTTVKCFIFLFHSLKRIHSLLKLYISIKQLEESKNNKTKSTYLKEFYFIIFKVNFLEQRRPHQRQFYDYTVTKTLNKWYDNHESHPYATQEQKKELADQTLLTEDQITRWLINARRKKAASKNSIS